MFRQAPETIASQLDTLISSLLIEAIHYFDVNDFEIRRLIAEAKKLISVDAYEGYFALGNIYHLCGDFDQMRIFHKKAERLKYHTDIHGWATACECNLGFVSIAQDHFKIVGNPKNGAFTKAFMLGIACGAFNLLNEFIEQAEKMQIDIAGFPLSIVQDANKILSHAGISDAEVAAILDLAGEVLREDQIFYSGGPEDIVHIDTGDSIDDACVHMTFRVALPGKVVARMGVRLAEKIAEKIENIPSQLHVSFRPA